MKHRVDCARVAPITSSGPSATSNLGQDLENASLWVRMDIFMLERAVTNLGAHTSATERLQNVSATETVSEQSVMQSVIQCATLWHSV